MKKQFLKYCSNNKLHKNSEQIKTLDLLVNFNKSNFSKKILLKLFTKKHRKLGFYLHGDVGVGKTMILNFFFDQLALPKQRMHFNEFMINFHNFRHNSKLQKKDNSIRAFVKNLKKNIDIIYLDEFQVTNIVDAIILGSLFNKIFNENIKVIFSSNIKINDLYKNGLQREQFIPFIKIMKKKCYEQQLLINQDYRKSEKTKLERFFSPLNEETTFHVSQMFRKITKEKKISKVKLNIKNRSFIINSFFEGTARFDFKDLCEVNFAAEGYIAISDKCNFIIIDNIPNFNDDTVNQQQRFITLIDILYEKKIPMIISANFDLQNYSSSRRLVVPYKRTISRLFELTSESFRKN